MVDIIDLVSIIKQDPNAMKLVGDMLLSNICEARPAVDVSAELGFSYPLMEKSLGLGTRETIKVLDFLAGHDVLSKHPYDKMLFCPHCRAANFGPELYCPECGSENIGKGRILEHFSCGNIGLEEEYIADGRYICPKCKRSLRFLGTDYRSLNIHYKCHSCGKVSQPGFT